MSADAAAPLENQVFARVGKLLHKYLKKHVAKISRVFKEFDTSGDGLVDKKEFTVGIRSIVGKNTMTKEEISDVWNFVDKDGGGTVDYMEFCKTIRELDAEKVDAAKKRKAKAAKVFDSAAYNKKQREEEKKKLMSEKKSPYTRLRTRTNSCKSLPKSSKVFVKKHVPRNRFVQKNRYKWRWIH